MGKAIHLILTRRRYVGLPRNHCRMLQYINIVKFSKTYPDTHFLSYNVSRPYCLASWSLMMITASSWGVSRSLLDELIVYVIEKISPTPLVVHGFVASSTDPYRLTDPSFVFVAFTVKNLGPLPVYVIGGCYVICSGWFSIKYMIKRQDSTVSKHCNSKSEYQDMSWELNNIKNYLLSWWIFSRMLQYFPVSKDIHISLHW